MTKKGYEIEICSEKIKNYNLIMIRTFVDDYRAYELLYQSYYELCGLEKVAFEMLSNKEFPDVKRSIHHDIDDLMYEFKRRFTKDGKIDKIRMKKAMFIDNTRKEE